MYHEILEVIRKPINNPRSSFNLEWDLADGFDLIVVPGLRCKHSGKFLHSNCKTFQSMHMSSCITSQADQSNPIAYRDNPLSLGKPKRLGFYYRKSDIPIHVMFHGRRLKDFGAE